MEWKHQKAFIVPYDVTKMDKLVVATEQLEV